MEKQGEDKCILCKDNYKLFNNICFESIEKLSRYDNNGKYINCTTSYKVSQSENIWIISIENCIGIDGDGKCTHCKDNYIKSLSHLQQFFFMFLPIVEKCFFN